MLKTTLLFFATALCEIIGCYLPWLWLKRGATPLLLIPTGLALALLAGKYSANAYAFSTDYQNCNQWVAEMLALAWGDVAVQGGQVRERAQDWLRAQGYVAGPVRVPGHLLMFAGQFVPLVHVDDHPVDDLHALALQVSVPASIEAFARQRAPQTQRVEICHDKGRIVVRRGWEPLGAACEPGPDDEVVMLTP